MKTDLATTTRSDDASKPFPPRICLRLVWLCAVVVGFALGYAGLRTAASISELAAAVHLQRMSRLRSVCARQCRIMRGPASRSVQARACPV